VFAHSSFLSMTNLDASFLSMTNLDGLFLSMTRGVWFN
jgi:hypothetical protein